MMIRYSRSQHVHEAHSASALLHARAYPHSPTRATCLSEQDNQLVSFFGKYVHIYVMLKVVMFLLSVSGRA